MSLQVKHELVRSNLGMELWWENSQLDLPATGDVRDQFHFRLCLVLDVVADDLFLEFARAGFVLGDLEGGIAGGEMVGAGAVEEMPEVVLGYPRWELALAVLLFSCGRNVGFRRFEVILGEEVEFCDEMELWFM